jgi:hypothetical protein
MLRMKMKIVLCLVALALLFHAAMAADKSGPQVGEKIESFLIRGILDDESGKNLDLVKDAGGKPLVLFFLHERTRPAIALARQVLDTAANRKSEGLESGLILLAADVPAMEEWVKMVPHVLPRGVPIGISTDGPQGPASYHLHGNFQVTIIIAKNNRVVANFCLAQPNIQDDASKISAAIDAALAK